MNRRLFFIIPLLLILPVAIASIGYQFHWNWFPLLELDDAPALLAYSMTLSIDEIGMAIILTVLSILVLRGWRHRPYQYGVFFFCLMAALGSAFVTKSVAKQYFKEPRPYVIWLAEQHRLPDSYSFYAQLPLTREQWLSDSFKGLPEEEVPNWLRLHWQDEVSYSFPSGHSIAAMTIASFYCLLFAYRRRSYWLIAGLSLWAVSVCYSRLLLGLHWPVDILASSLAGVTFGMLGASTFIYWDKREVKTLSRKP